LKKTFFPDNPKKALDAQKCFFNCINLQLDAVAVSEHCAASSFWMKICAIDPWVIAAWFSSDL